jgi:RNA polymerase sigma factor (sigma-70 family)
VTTDSAIIRRSLDDPSAFAELFRRHARVVGAFAARRIGSQAAQDLLSETFLVAFRRRAAFDPTWDSALPWLLGIASRLVKKHRADEARQWRAIAASGGVAEPAHDGELARADERGDAAAAVTRLAGAIGALADRDRETLLLHAWGDLTYEEIAVALQVPVGTVRSRLNRVRRKLGVDAMSVGIGREEGRDGRVEQGA